MCGFIKINIYSAEAYTSAAVKDYEHRLVNLLLNKFPVRGHRTPDESLKFGFKKPRYLRSIFLHF
jgi:hypothetical protein